LGVRHKRFSVSGGAEFRFRDLFALGEMFQAGAPNSAKASASLLGNKTSLALNPCFKEFLLEVALPASDCAEVRSPVRRGRPMGKAKPDLGVLRKMKEPPPL